MKKAKKKTNKLTKLQRAILKKQKERLEMERKNKIHVTLILSGGAIDGVINHLAFLQAWDSQHLNNKYIIDRIIGTSAGALVGSLYANNITPQKIFDIFLDSISYWDLIKSIKISGINFLKNYYLIKPNKMYSILQEYLPDNFNNLYTKFACISTNVSNGTYKVFHKGNELPKKVLSSMAFPSAFPKIKIDNKDYIDGGVLKNVGVNLVDRLAEYNPNMKYIVIDNSPFENPNNPTINYPYYNNYIQMVMNLFNIIRNNLKILDYSSINKENYKFIRGNRLNGMINLFNWAGLLNPFKFNSLKTKLKKYYNPCSLMYIYYKETIKLQKETINHET